MEFIIKPRQSGKTLALLERLQADETLVYVAASRRQALAAYKQAAGLGFDIAQERFKSPQEVAYDRIGGEASPVVVDEPFDVLEALLRSPIVATAFTAEEQE